MKGHRFYRERGGNVVALLPGAPERFDRQPLREAVASVYAHPDSPVASCAVSLDYLRSECARISEARARRTHPQLFAYLERGA